MITLKPFIVRTVLCVMGKSITVLGKHQNPVKEMAEAFGEGEGVRMCTLQGNASLELVKHNGRMRHVKPGSAKNIILIFEFKNIEHLYKLCTARLSLHVAYAEHRMTVNGDIGRGMSVLRAVYFVEGTLFPWFIAKHVLKRRIKGANKVATYTKLLFARRAKVQ